MNARIIFGALLITGVGGCVARSANITPFIRKRWRATLRRVLRRSRNFRTSEFAADIQSKGGRSTLITYRGGIRQRCFLIVLNRQRLRGQIRDLGPISGLLILGQQFRSFCVCARRDFNASRISFDRGFMQKRWNEGLQTCHDQRFHRSTSSFATFFSFRLPSTIVNFRRFYQFGGCDLSDN